MNDTSSARSPRRITDLILAKDQGAEVVCTPSFEIIPVDFIHQASQFQAFIFLCRYSGTIAGREFNFRKCYARGCPNNLCLHVSQAVMIANRYLQRDYHKLKQAGIAVDENKTFTLDQMVVKFEDYQDTYGPPITLDDVIQMAKQGQSLRMEIETEYLPAVEHFANHKNEQTFMHANFIVSGSGKTYRTQRCLACFPTAAEAEEKPTAIGIANERLKLLYQSLDEHGVQYEKRFFE